jgi:type VI secretion system secreted protein Hcp
MERVQRFRFRVVGPDGTELVSDVVHVQQPPSAEPLAAAKAVAGSAPAEEYGFPVTAIFVAVKGKTQGFFKGEGGRAADKKQFAALALDYEVKTPRDSATGQPSGKRQHLPLSVVKEWGAATPQLFQALVTNEVLETVDIDCYGHSAEGKEAIAHRVKLSNAHVVSIQQAFGTKAAGHPGLQELETVAFAFEKIEHRSPDGAVLASDDWQAKA